MSDEVRFQRAPGWVWRRTRGSVLVMGPDQVAHQLDGAAALTWLALQEPGSPADLVARSRDHLGDEVVDAEADAELAGWVTEAIASLVDQAMVCVAAAESGHGGPDGEVVP